MGVMRMQSTMRNHPAMKDCLSVNIPHFELLMLDYNAIIHTVFQDVITKFNELMYFLHGESYVAVGKSRDYSSNTAHSVESLIDFYEDMKYDYSVGETIDQICSNISEEKFMMNVLIKETVKYTDRLIARLNNGNLKRVHLFIDGVPSMAKIREQRDRRYLGAYMQRVKNEIERKYRAHATSVYQIDLPYYKTMICVGTYMMSVLEKELRDLKYDFEFDISPMTERGEGEKKIMTELARIWGDYESVCIMSPDSDMLILANLIEKSSNRTKLYLFRIDHHQSCFNFIDQEKFLNNMIEYYSHSRPVEKKTIVYSFFLLFVFGNDFLPIIEPLDISKHFNAIFEIAIRTCEEYEMIINGELNYDHILKFFERIEEHTLQFASEKIFLDRFTNYEQMCKSLSVVDTDLQRNHHNDALKCVTVDHNNIFEKIYLVKNRFNTLLNYLKKNHVNDLDDLYYEIHQDVDDSYLLMVLPKICRIDGLKNDDRLAFFKSFARQIFARGIFQLRIKLLERNYDRNASNRENYVNEMEKLEKSQEPYRSMFGMKPIELVKEEHDNIVDVRDRYYDLYVKANMTKTEKQNMIKSYLTGVEFLFRYYLLNENEQWNSWSYNWLQAPLLKDVIFFMKKNNCSVLLLEELKKLPKHTMTPTENYFYVTPNDYTGENVSVYVDDIIPFIRGEGALYCNRVKIDWSRI